MKHSHSIPEDQKNYDQDYGRQLKSSILFWYRLKQIILLLIIVANIYFIYYTYEFNMYVSLMFVFYLC